MDNTISWAQLGTVAGVATATSVLTQIIKRYIPKADPKWIALILSVVVSLSAMVVISDVNFETFVITLLNAVIAAGAAVGEYEVAIKPIVDKRR